MNRGPKRANPLFKNLKGLGIVGGVVTLIGLAIYPVWLAPMKNPAPWRKQYSFLCFVLSFMKAFYFTYCTAIWTT